jgi:Flp pilus assembly protein TadD
VPANGNDQLDLKDTRSRHHKAAKEQGDAYAEAGRYDQAERCYTEAAALAPNAPEPYVGLGTIYLQTGDLEKAEWAFRIAQRVQPNCSEAHGGLAMVYQRRKAYPAAFNMYLKSLELDTDNLVALLGLFQTSCQMGTFSMITEYLERYLRMHPDDPSVLFCLASLYAREMKLPQARQALVEVLKLQPNKFDAARLLAAVEKRLAADSPKEKGA